MEKSRILKTRQKLRHEKKNPTTPRIISELTFGFWVSLLNSQYEESLWRPILSKSFNHKPKHINRKQLKNILTKIQRLRNRVAHYEPIIHYPLDNNYHTIIEIISWSCPKTAAWVDKHNNFLKIIRRSNKIYSNLR